MTQDNANSVTVGGEPLVSAARFNIKPLMAAYMTCAMAMMAFASLIGPIGRAIAAFGPPAGRRGGHRGRRVVDAAVAAQVSVE